MTFLTTTLKKLIKKTVFISIYSCVLFLPNCTNGSTADSHVNTIYHTDDEIIDQFSSQANLDFYQQYRLALAYKTKKQYSSAKKHFLKAAFSRTPEGKSMPDQFAVKHHRTEYYDISAYHLTDIFYHEYSYNTAVRLYEFISKKDPSVYFDASLIAANCFVSLKQYSKAADLLKHLRTLTETNNSRETLRQIRLAGVYSKNESYGTSKNIYLDIIKKDSSSWQKNIAANNLYGFLTQKKISLSKKEQLTLSRTLLDNNKTNESLALINEYNDKESTLLKIEILVKDKKVASAEKLANKQKSKNDYLKTLADSLWGKGYRSKPVSIYTRYKFHETDKNILLKVIDYYSKRNLKTCEKYLKMYLEKYNDSSVEYYVWTLAKENIEKGNDKTAVRILKDYKRKFPEGTYLGNSIYWLWKLTNSNTELALRELILKKPSSVYTWILFHQNENSFDSGKSKSRFNKSIENRNMDNSLFDHFIISYLEKEDSEFTDRLNKINSEGMNSYGSFNNYLSDSRFSKSFREYHKILSSYFAAGDISAIINLYTFLEEDKKNQKELYKSIYQLSKKYSYYYYEYIFTRKLLNLYNLEENVFLLNPEISKSLYPKAFSATVEKHSAEHKIAPELIYGIMRTESAFNPNARSSSNARGLMQLMPPTLKDVAKRMKLKDYNITNVEDNIKIGTWYFDWLLDYFDNNKIFALGAYNGGMGNMNKWKKQYDSNDELYFIEKIPYPETRNYILMILKYELVYKKIY